MDSGLEAHHGYPLPRGQKTEWNIAYYSNMANDGPLDFVVGFSFFKVYEFGGLIFKDSGVLCKSRQPREKETMCYLNDSSKPAQTGK